eukprot:1815902-Alexandrium_andersonii.AAC.1
MPVATRLRRSRAPTPVVPRQRVSPGGNRPRGGISRPPSLAKPFGARRLRPLEFRNTRLRATTDTFRLFGFCASSQPSGRGFGASRGGALPPRSLAGAWGG